MKSITLSIPIVLILIIVVFACNSNRPRNEEQSRAKVIANDALQVLLSSKERYDQALAENGIRILGVWRIGENQNDKLYYLTKEKPAEEENSTGGEFLRIYDSSHNLIFEEDAVSFGGIEVVPILRQARGQLVIKSINNGGSGSFFQVLDYQGGKIVSLTNEEETLYSGEITIFPQYQDGEKHYSAPYQFFLNDHVISSSPTASVLRFSNGKYVNVGKLDLVEAGKSIDRNISKR